MSGCFPWIVNNPLNSEIVDHPRYTEVRDRFRALLGQEISDHDWLILYGYGVVAPEMESVEIEGAVETFQRIQQEQRAQISKRSAEREAHEKSDERIAAFAYIASRQAAREPGVKKWREAYLPDRLLAPKEVRDFIETHKVPGQSEGRRIKKIGEARILAIFAPSEEWIDRDVSLDDYLILEVSDSPVLGELVAAGENLAHHFWWSDISAFGFILTGGIPIPRQIVSRTDERRFGPPVIVLEIDPRTSSAEVRARYEEDRQFLVQKGRLGKTAAQSRRLIEKTGQLAVFVSESHGSSWGELRRQWNSLFPIWAIEDDRRFARDGRRAWVSVTGEPYRSIGN